MTGVNTGIMLDPYAPFGGIKESGFGREGGRHGIEGVPNQQDNHSWRSGVTIKSALNMYIDIFMPNSSKLFE